MMLSKLHNLLIFEMSWPKHYVTNGI